MTKKRPRLNRWQMADLADTLAFHAGFINDEVYLRLATHKCGILMEVTAVPLPGETQVPRYTKYLKDEQGLQPPSGPAEEEVRKIFDCKRETEAALPPEQAR